MDFEYLEKLFLKYRNTGIIIDTNILLAFFIGIFDPQLISRFKRTKEYSIDDFYTILRVIKYFEKILTTPNILTEVSNLSNQLPEHIKNNYYDEFKKHVSLLNENYFESKVICNTSHFNKYVSHSITSFTLFRTRKLI